MVRQLWGVAMCVLVLDGVVLLLLLWLCGGVVDTRGVAAGEWISHSRPGLALECVCVCMYVCMYVCM